MDNDYFELDKKKKRKRKKNRRTSSNLSETESGRKESLTLKPLEPGMIFDPSSKELNYTKDLLNSTYNPNESSLHQNSMMHNHMQMYPPLYQYPGSGPRLPPTQTNLFLNDTMFENFNDDNKEKNVSANVNTNTSPNAVGDPMINLRNPNIVPNQNALPPFMPAGNLMPPHPMFLGRNMNMVFPQPFPGTQNIFPQNMNIVTEPLEINNIYLFNNKFDIPNDKSVWYIYNHIQSMTSLPISSIQLFDLYNMKIINGEVDVRPIDIFQFAEQMPFSFVKLKVINDINWIDRIIDNQLLKYTELFTLSAKIKGEFSEKHKNRKLSNRKSSNGSYNNNYNKNNNKEYEKLAGESNNNYYNSNKYEEENFEVVRKKKKSKNETTNTNTQKNINNANANVNNNQYANTVLNQNANQPYQNQYQQNRPQTAQAQNQNVNLNQNQKPSNNNNNKQKVNSNTNAKNTNLNTNTKPTLNNLLGKTPQNKNLNQNIIIDDTLNFNESAIDINHNKINIMEFTNVEEKKDLLKNLQENSNDKNKAGLQNILNEAEGDWETVDKKKKKKKELEKEQERLKEIEKAKAHQIKLNEELLKSKEKKEQVKPDESYDIVEKLKANNAYYKAKENIKKDPLEDLLNNKKFEVVVKKKKKKTEGKKPPGNF